ncbi:MAG: hypothetical protein LC746_09170 [Acidobacteria bacterium]|nr:hypothetical protein [Acidobacteriota bacterium]
MPERGGARTRVVHQNLDTAYLNLAALVRHLQQRDFTGRVHVELDEYDADIFLAARERPRACERDHVTGREAEGEAALQRIFVRASEPGGRVSVFEGEADGAAEAGASPDAPSSLAGDGGRAASAHDEVDRRNVLQLSGEVIAAVERAVVATTGGEFASHFRAARSELADDYPFLASLASCVEYVNGEPRLARATRTEEFVAGVSDALRRVVERAAAGEGGARGVRREVARELAALEERRPRALARFGFAPRLEHIAGIRWT